jgi:hypothetical protein
VVSEQADEVEKRGKGNFSNTSISASAVRQSISYAQFTNDKL